MISIENEVLNKVKNAVVAVYPNMAFVDEELLNAPSEFPTLSLYEADNYALRSSQDTASNENHVRVMYEANVYTNKLNGKKSEAKAILNIVDTELTRLGFTRTLKRPVALSGGHIYQYVARYEAVIGKDHSIYRR